MLRDYQYHAVSEIRDALPRHKSVLFQLETGAGKSICAGTLAVEGAQQGRQSLYLVHREELLDQTVKTLAGFGLGGEVGVIAAGHPITPWSPLQVGMIQTVTRRLGELDWLNPWLVIYDECHHIRAASWMRVQQFYCDAVSLGLTATPARLDGKGLGDCFNYMVEGPPPDALVLMGWLAAMEVCSVEVGLDLSNVKRTGGDFDRKAADARVTGPVIAKGVENVLRLAAERRLIHYAHSIRHSKAFADQMSANGIRCEHVDGTMNPLLRGNIIDRFRSGQTQMLSNVELLNEGLDVPECNAVALGRKTASLQFYRQAAGRAKRPKKDGSGAILVDLAGNLDIHGRPDYPLEWSLTSGATDESRLKAKRDYRICGNCGFLNTLSATVCEKCGYAPAGKVPVEVDVDLVYREGSKKDATRSRREMNQQILETGGDVAQLRAIQREYGMPESIIARWQKIWGPLWKSNKVTA